MPRRRLVSDQQVQFTGEGQTVVGKYKDVEEVYMATGTKLNKYIFENELGIMIIMGTSQIDTAMARVNVGEMVEVTYKGTVPTSNGFHVKLFEVAVLEDAENDGEE